MKYTKIKLRSDCGRNFEIDAHEVADHRSTYYKNKDPDTTYTEEYDWVIQDSMELTDWLFNNMDWYECKTLKEVDPTKLPLNKLSFEDYWTE